MNSFEWFLLMTLCASLVVGPLLGRSIGIDEERRRGRKSQRDAALAPKDREYSRGRRDGYFAGYEAGVKDSTDCEVTATSGQYAPLRAADVRLSE